MFFSSFSRRPWMKLENLSSSTLANGVWKIHGSGWRSMPIPGGVGLITTMTGSPPHRLLRSMQTKENTAVSCYHKVCVFVSICIVAVLRSGGLEWRRFPDDWGSGLWRQRPPEALSWNDWYRISYRVHHVVHHGIISLGFHGYQEHDRYHEDGITILYIVCSVVEILIPRLYSIKNLLMLTRTKKMVCVYSL